jgi:magnesium chelatase subunit I
LLGQAIRTTFTQYFPDPQSYKKNRDNQKGKQAANPYQPIIDWFGKGNDLMLVQEDSDAHYLNQLYKVNGLHATVKQFYPNADDTQAGLLMEFLLHGLSEFSLISKKGIEKGGYAFGDILGSMLNMSFTEDEE